MDNPNVTLIVRLNDNIYQIIADNGRSIISVTRPTTYSSNTEQFYCFYVCERLYKLQQAVLTQATHLEIK